MTCRTSPPSRAPRTSRKSRLLAAALLLSLTPAVVLPPRAAFAQGSDDAATKMARQRFQEGVASYDKHDYELARASFLQAYALRKHPAVLLNLAQSSLKSGHALEAARYFQQFLREYSAATAAQRSDAESGLAEARTHIGRIDVSSAPSGAEILIDGESIGIAPFEHPIDVEPGSHTVKAHGQNDETVTVISSAGSVITARFAAPAPTTAAAPVPAPTPPAEEPAPAEPPPAAPNEAAPAPAPPTPASQGTGILSPPSNIAPVIVGGVVTLVGVGTAIVFGIEKSSAQNSANSEAALIVANGGVQGSATKPGTCYQPQGNYVSPCGILNSDNNNVNTDALIGNIALGVGIAGAAFTVLYWAFAWKGDAGGGANATSAATTSSVHPVIEPMIGKGTGGLSLGASF
jgi:hypothetical protein